jgi:hypothetical protein
VQFAWQALAVLLPETTVNTAGCRPRLLREVWSEHASRRWHGEQGLLALATGTGSPELIPYLVSALDSELPRTQELSVAALAAITRWGHGAMHPGRRDPCPKWSLTTAGSARRHEQHHVTSFESRCRSGAAHTPRPVAGAPHVGGGSSFPTMHGA